VVDLPSFTERTRASLREALLVAATELLPEKGFAGLRMADVASHAGVCRQTVYNEFGNKTALVQAVVLRTTGEFLEGVSCRLDDAPDLVTGIRRAVRYTIEHASENRLVAAALGAEEGLLPLLTTKGEPILRAACELGVEHYRTFEPGLSAEDAAVIAEAVVRLSLSHLVLRTHTAAEAADSVCAAIAPAIRHYSSTGRPGTD
jgi:AcrR family transcriptional regulator